MPVAGVVGGAGPGEAQLVVDVDSFVGEVYGYEKQGAGYGYTHRRGYHPILATRRTLARCCTSVRGRGRRIRLVARCGSLKS